MENFYYNDIFCPSISEMLEEMGLESEQDVVESLVDDWTFEVETTNKEKMFELDEDKLFELLFPLFEERMDEDGSQEEDVRKAIRHNVNILLFNENIPELHYPNGTMATITRQDLIDYIKS